MTGSDSTSDANGVEQKRPEFVRALVIAAAVCVIVISLKLSAGFLSPILVGLWITMLCIPLVDTLRRRGVPGWLAILLPVGTLVSIMFVGAYLVVAWIAEFVNDIPTYQAQLSAKRAELDAWLTGRGITMPAANSDHQINFSTIISFIESVLPTTIQAVASILFIVLILAYALVETDSARARLKQALGPGNPNLARLSLFVQVVGKAMGVRALLGGAAAFFDGVLLIILGVPQVGLWVVISFICSFIPYIGYWIALIPPVLVALAMHGIGTAVVVFFGYWFINGFFDSIVGPKVQGNMLNLSPVVTMIAVLFWGALFGAIGGMMALPLTLGIKILLLDAFPESRWFSMVIESDPRPDADTEPAPPG